MFRFSFLLRWYMGRIRTIKPEFHSHNRYFKKKRIPVSTRMAVAMRYGCSRGVEGDAWCVYCNSPGRVKWEIGYKGPTTRVTFPGLELDHILPEFLGGTDDQGNIVL